MHESVVDHAQDLLDVQVRGISLDPGDLRIGVDQGYAIQREGRSLRTRAGDRLVGHKVGLTSAASRKPYAASEPVSGYLLGSTVTEGTASYSLRGLANARVEAEIAFFVSATLGGETTTGDEVVAATSEVALALEIVSSRWSGGAPSAGHLVADNVSAAGVILGERMSSVPSFDEARVVVQAGSATVHGDATNVFESPEKSVAWLVRHLASAGEQVNAGDIVMSGSFITPHPVAPGDVLVADYGPLGQISVTFTE
jgi:2-keto-4-pentenoate hydratase